MERQQLVKKLKKQRKQLLKEVGLSMTKFKRKMPKVKVFKTGGFDVVADRNKGKKPSLWQQVSWLIDFKEATSELTKEVLSSIDKSQKTEYNEEEVKNEKS